MHRIRAFAHIWQHTSLQTRITALTTMLIAGGLLLSGIGTHAMLRSYLETQVDSQLKRTAVTLAKVPWGDIANESSPVSTLLPTTYYAAFYAGETQIVALGNLEVGNIPDEEVLQQKAYDEPDGEPYSVTEGHGTEWRLVNMVIGDAHTLQVGMPIDTMSQTLVQYTNIFVGFGILVVMAGGVGAWFMAGSLFAPLRRAEDAAATIAAGDYSKRLPDTAPTTEVGRLNRSLNVMTDRIEAAFAARVQTVDQMRRFVSDASHELRTPLVSVRGYAELYRMGALKDETDIAQAMDRIEKEAVRMGLLVEDLLALARLDERRPLETAPVDLRALARDTALDAMAREPEREVNVVDLTSAANGSSAENEGGPSATTPVNGNKATSALNRTTTGILRIMRRQDRERAREEARAVAAAADASAAASADQNDDTRPVTVIGPTAQPIVLGEENKLRQVLTNLVGNALRFTPDGSPLEIVVDADAVHDVAVVEVRDHGPGIPPQVRQKIFERFWRADNSRARDTGGSGLGLAIVAAIVSAHGGSVEALETPGGGATFRVVLPLYSPEAASE